MTLTDKLILLIAISVITFTIFLIWIVVLLNSIRWFLAQDLAIKVFLKDEYLKDSAREGKHDLRENINPIYVGSSDRKINGHS